VGDRLACAGQVHTFEPVLAGVVSQSPCRHRDSRLALMGQVGDQ